MLFAARMVFTWVFGRAENEVGGQQPSSRPTIAPIVKHSKSQTQQELEETSDEQSLLLLEQAMAETEPERSNRLDRESLSILVEQTRLMQMGKSWTRVPSDPQMSVGSDDGVQSLTSFEKTDQQNTSTEFESLGHVCCNEVIEDDSDDRQSRIDRTLEWLSRLDLMDETDEVRH